MTDAVDLQVIGAGGQRLGDRGVHARGRALGDVMCGRIGERDGCAGGVEQIGTDVEIRAHRCRIHLDGGGTGGLEAEHVLVRPRGDAPGGRYVRARGEHRGRRPCVTVVVCPHRGARSDDGQVILGVVGVGVFTPAPLGDGVIVRGAHDRGPRALPQVVGAGAVGVGAVVAQAEVVTNLVGDSLGDELGVLQPQILREDQGRLVVHVAEAVIEHVDVGDATAAARGAYDRVLGDESPGAVDLITRVAAVDGGRARVLGGHVNVERGVVLADALPDLLNGVLLTGPERVGVAVGVERRGEPTGSRWCAVLDRPGPVRRDLLTVEVEVDRPLGAGFAVQQERLAVRKRRRGGR